MHQPDESNSSGGHVLNSGRVNKPPSTWCRAYPAIGQHNAIIATSSNEIPKSYKEAATGPDAKFWERGIDSETDSLKRDKTWTLVPRSAAQGRKVLTTKWVYVEKQEVDKDGNVTPFPKGRNVVRRFRRGQGVDYGETFAPVVKYTYVRVLCADDAQEDLEFYQMGAKTAFLNAEIDEETIIEIPDGVGIEGKDIVEFGLGKDVDLQQMNLVCKLKSPCTVRNKLRTAGIRESILFYLMNLDFKGQMWIHVSM